MKKYIFLGALFINMHAFGQLSYGPFVGYSHYVMEKMKAFTFGAYGEVLSMNQRGAGISVQYGISGVQDPGEIYKNATRFDNNPIDNRYTGEIKANSITAYLYYKHLFGDNEGDQGFHVKLGMGVMAHSFKYNFTVENYLDNNYFNDSDTYSGKLTSTRFLVVGGFGYDYPTNFGSVFAEIQGNFCMSEPEVPGIMSNFWIIVNAQIGVRKIMFN